MRFKRIVAAAVAAIALSPLGAVAPAHAAPTPGSSVVSIASASAMDKKVKCTRTNSGSCIKRGQFCAKAMRNKSGRDGKGQKLHCRKSGSYLRWK
ncbi:MAG: hypothetical protein FWD59_04125 [Micrococcales bacterium]|nr:hypothetical protein [Micrococcales bacterium]